MVYKYTKPMVDRDSNSSRRSLYSIASGNQTNDSPTAPASITFNQSQMIFKCGGDSNNSTTVRNGSIASNGQAGNVPPNEWRRNSHVDRMQIDHVISHKRSLDDVTKKVGWLPKQPVYGDDWDLKYQPAGSVQFMHLNQKGNQVEISSFTPGLDGKSRPPTYCQKSCKYPLNATPEEAGFVEPPSKLLGQWTATAIGANDVTSSIIFTAGLVSVSAGYYTPLSLLIVVLLLGFFRTIYVELVSALPLNGGTYTAMLNTTRKSFAMVAACLSFLSYSATAVTCAVSAMSYLKSVWPGLIVVAGTIVVVAVFASLLLIGLNESAIVAATIFFTHLVVLAILASCSIAYAVHTKAANIVDHYWTHPGPANPANAIVLGFASGMLGITGFETTANFVQQQKPGVFSKTLRNMWAVVVVINPIIGFLCFAVIPYKHFYEGETGLVVRKEVVDSLLAVMAKEMEGFVGGNWLRYLIIADAIFVLCGSVLTSFVGVVGLLSRMVDDDIFPRSWTARTPRTGTQYPIILFFALLCSGLVILTWGDLSSVSGVFVICFLCVMFLFCLCNLIMKRTRKDLKRETRAKWYVVLMCMLALIIAVAGNCVSDPVIIFYSAVYITICMSVFCCMTARTFLIRAFLTLTEKMEAKSYRFVGHPLKRFRTYLVDVLYSIEQLPVVFFSRNLNIREMNLAAQRVLSDELTRRLTFVHFYSKIEDIPENFNYERLILDTHMFPNLQIDAILIKGKFGPGAVRLTECILGVPPNRMFIGAPSQYFPYDLAELGSVRIILPRQRSDDDHLAVDGCLVGADNSGYEFGSKEHLANGDVEKTIIPFHRFFSMSGPDASYLSSALTGLGLKSAPSQVKKSMFKKSSSAVVGVPGSPPNCAKTSNRSHSSEENVANGVVANGTRRTISSETDLKLSESPRMDSVL